MKRLKLGRARRAAARAVLCSALMAATAWSSAWSAVLPLGTLINGSASGATSELLGLDGGYAPGPLSNVTGLSDADPEFLSGDYALSFDFSSDGLLRVYNYGFSDLLPGDYDLSFEFQDLQAELGGVDLIDLSAVSTGTVSATLLGGHALHLHLEGVSIDGPFGSFTAQISTVAEPGSLALTLFGMLLMMAGCARIGRGRINSGCPAARPTSGGWS